MRRFGLPYDQLVGSHILWKARISGHGVKPRKPYAVKECKAERSAIKKTEPIRVTIVNRTKHC